MSQCVLGLRESIVRRKVDAQNLMTIETVMLNNDLAPFLCGEFVAVARLISETAEQVFLQFR